MDEIALFPLSTVLLPGTPLPLHVFEPRYQTMMADLLGDEIPGPPGGPPERSDGEAPAFGVARIREGLEVGGRAETHRVGVLAAIEWVRRQPDGTMELLTRGTRRFRIAERLDDDPYPHAKVSFLDELAGDDADDALAFAKRAYGRYERAVAQLLRSEPEDVALPDDPVAASYALIAAMSLEASVVQALLEAPTATERLVRAARIARSEAGLLRMIGPPARQPTIRSSSLN
ncbi:MAG TPA: LON peptidase substrate-binding domain-containing protein [Actinomycetota bacterium]|nr:LON peptidase substrate-binding domain-containing protein [Actinomycetota bacterium]